ncbi:unnamed protein product [Protopolystoma xenopodis]|uniref:Helix-turn-helix domain-containing protein n=1 Tax=Protopolystoma xenopodis TaxID=117903 RepID=A0A3S5BPU5_9PLAT|nr:unnamed protein product [Protopolystoma xenopodis]
MVTRSPRLTAPQFWEDELEKLTQMFLGNGYPEEAIQHNIRMVMNGRKSGYYERKSRETEKKGWTCLPSCEFTLKKRRILWNWNIRITPKDRTTLLTSLSTQLQEVIKMECSGMYRIKLQGL